MTLMSRRRDADQGLPAGFVTRLLAISIDLALLSATVTTVTVLGQFIGTNLHVGTTMLRWLAIGSAWFGIVLYAVYFISLHVLGGQTIGKRIMGIRLARVDGARVSLKTSIKRYIGIFISLPLFWGYLLVLIDNRRQAFHDKLADTVVIYYTAPPGELGCFEQHLRALRLRRETRLAAEKAAAESKLFAE